jgi:hypothetical protein
MANSHTDLGDRESVILQTVSAVDRALAAIMPCTAGQQRSADDDKHSPPASFHLDKPCREHGTSDSKVGQILHLDCKAPNT